MGTVYKTYQELEDEDHERYLKKQADIQERRRAKIEAEGHKCTVEGCGEAFKDPFLLRSHINDHNDEFRKRMMCNKAKCGAKFNNRRDYNEHIDNHKEEDKAKVINSIRSVLLYNKHGLLMESFEREYRGVTGKKIPYVMMGFSSLYDLLTNLPDVVQVTNLPGGQSLLLAVPDKATEHIAKMVGNQRTNREGFNYRTGEVLHMVGRDTIRKIEKSVESNTRRVPEFMKKQVEQLMNLDMYEEGLELNEFREVYDQEFGYPLEFECYGFYSFQDLVYHGLEGVVELLLDGFSWRLTTPQSSQFKARTSHVQELTREIKENIVKLLSDNPFGVSIPTFTKIYEECFGKLDLRQLRFKDGVELCLLNPDVCNLHRAEAGDYTVFPVGKEVHGSNTMWMLGEVKNNVWRMLKSVSFGVPLAAFIRGYEGHYGQLNFNMLQCKDLLELCKSMPEVCEVKSDENGQEMIRPVFSSQERNQAYREEGNENRIPPGLFRNIQRVLSHCTRGIPLSKLALKFLEIVGENINFKRFGFSDLRSLLRILEGSLLKMSVLSKDPIVKLCENVGFAPETDFGTPVVTESMNEDGWFKILKFVSPGLIFIQMDSTIDMVSDMETSLDRFYMTGKGRPIKVEMLRVGVEVAALSSDLTWYRGRVITIEEERGVAEVLYLDHGERAEVRIETLRYLETEFRELPGQAIGVSLSGVKLLSGKEVWSREGIAFLEDTVIAGNRRAWVQKRKCMENLQVDIFIDMAGSGMSLINKILCDMKVVEKVEGHMDGVVGISQYDEDDVSEKKSDCAKYVRDLQRLVLYRLAGIGRNIDHCC